MAFTLNEVMARFKGPLEGEIRKGIDCWIIIRGEQPLAFSLPLTLRSGQSGLTELENEITYRKEKGQQ